MTRSPRVSFLLMSVTVVAAAAVLRRGQLRWGATHTEISTLLAGDEVVPEPDLTATRAITIHAGVDDVWPWIVQLGQGRGCPRPRNTPHWRPNSAPLVATVLPTDGQILPR